MELLNTRGAGLLSTILQKLGSEAYRKTKITKPKNTETDGYFMIHDSMSSKRD